MGIFTWWMEPPLQASDWKPALSARGFGFSDDTPGMAMTLEALDESPGAGDKLEVRAVTDDESLRK